MKFGEIFVVVVVVLLGAVLLFAIFYPKPNYNNWYENVQDKYSDIYEDIDTVYYYFCFRDDDIPFSEARESYYRIYDFFSDEINKKP